MYVKNWSFHSMARVEEDYIKSTAEGMASERECPPKSCPQMSF